VAEYLVYNPLGDTLNRRIHGFRMLGGRYSSIPQLADGSLLSFAVGLTFRIEGYRLRLVDTATGELLLRDEKARNLVRRAWPQLHGQTN
jgi:hypothetical protein